MNEPYEDLTLSSATTTQTPPGEDSSELAGGLKATRRGLGTGARDEIKRLSRRVDVHPFPLTVAGAGS